MLLRPLPYRDPDRLVRIFFNKPGLGLRDVRFSKPELERLVRTRVVPEDRRLRRIFLTRAGLAEHDELERDPMNWPRTFWNHCQISNATCSPRR